MSMSEGDTLLPFANDYDEWNCSSDQADRVHREA